MAIEWELYRKIRQLYLVEKVSQREIARLLSVSRKTIRKYCAGATLPDFRKKPGRESHLLKKVEDDIARLLEENRSLPRKERRTGKDIWKYLLQEKGIAIGETTVRKFIRELRNSHPEVYLPLEHEPGDSIQFDWGDMTAYIGSTRVPVSVFCCTPIQRSCLRLCLPGQDHLVFCPRPYPGVRMVPRRQPPLYLR